MDVTGLRIGRFLCEHNLKWYISTTYDLNNRSKSDLLLADPTNSFPHTYFLCAGLAASSAVRPALSNSCGDRNVSISVPSFDGMFECPIF